VKGFIVAIEFLTILGRPGARREVTPQEIGQSAAFFPIVGLALGAILVLCNRLLEGFVPAPLLGVVLVALLILMTRGFHLDGLADTFDGLGAKGGREEALRAMRDSSTGVFGLLALVVVVLLKYRSLEIMGDARARALLLSPTLGRWAMVLLAYGAPSPRAGLGRMVVQAMKTRHLIFASATAAASAWLTGGLSGLYVALAVSALTGALRSCFQRRFGGVTGDTCGAVEEMSEALSLALLASLSSGS
jgi:adenosylcobinamide-GDP ribazoletransferase